MWQGQRSGDREPGRAHSFLRSFLQPSPAVADDALTTLLIVCAMWLAALILPQLAALRLDVDALHTQVVANENDAFCEAWGLTPGSRDHAQCTADLDRIRAAERTRILERPIAYD
jgi:hypothetical protein